MLPVSSATISCSCHGQIPVYGGLKTVSSYPKAFDCNNMNKASRKFSNFSRRKGATCFYSNYVGKGELCNSVDTINESLYQSGCSTQFGVSHESHHFVPNIVFVNSSSESAGDNQLTDFISKTVDSTDLQLNYTDLDFPISVNDVPIDSPFVSDSLSVDVNPLSDQNTQLSGIAAQVNDSVADFVNGGENAVNKSFDTISSNSLSVDVNPLSDQNTQLSGITAQVNDSVAEFVNGGENALNKSLDTITSSLNAALTSANEAFDNFINDVTTFLNKTGESAGNKLGGLSSGVKQGSGAAGSAVVDVLRRAVVTVEDILSFGTKNIGYAYDSAKGFLPQEYQDVLRSSEGRVIGIFSPIGAAFKQVYVALGGFEKSIGLDPNDPLIPVVLVFGVSAILWGSYRVLKYSGYAGDLTPESALELLKGNDNAVLIDIRPENLRDRDGVPDLRRSARFRYASITLPEVNSSVKKLLKGGRDLDDSLLAAVIRDLKIVQDRSNVLVMDADGSRSKGVARSLRKLGTKRPYQVLGGFQSWVKEGCRVKELKPETALTILNEEAEAILEELKPTPLKVLGLGVGLAALTYSLSEWETTLQYIGVIGLELTICRRIASYQGSEDFKQDLRFLLAPVALGGQAISWASGKLETNRNGLPTSPSSPDVQSRVLQAAAKHESQPDSAETQDLPQVAASGNEEDNEEQEVEEHGQEEIEMTEQQDEQKGREWRVYRRRGRD